MPRIRTLTLTPEQKAELLELRDRQPKAYLRERAAALLKIAEGAVPSQVARTGLLKARDPDSVYAWLDAYEAQGSAGLAMKKGRGRKPCFSPTTADG